MAATRPVLLSLLVLGAASAVACDREQERASATAEVAIADAEGAASASEADASSGRSASASSDQAGTGKPTFAEGTNGEVWMSTRDGTMRMGIRHDSVLMAFSDSLRRAVKLEIDTSMKRDVSEADGEIGKAIGGIVQSTVKAALTEVFDKERGFPIADVRDVRYEGGEIRFDFRKKPLIRPDQIKNDEVPFTKRFHPADAARFVGAVRGRMQSTP